VPIPQGVRNWRPPDSSEKDRVEDSLLSESSKVSSVFKGVAYDSNYINSQSAEQKVKINKTENSNSRATNENPLLRSSLIARLDNAEDSLAKGWNNGKSNNVNKVVCYRDPVIDMDMPHFVEQDGKCLISRKAFSKKRRKVIILSAPVLIVIIILIHRYCFHSSPQESEASESIGPPASSMSLISMSDVKNDVDSQVLQILPEQVTDFLRYREEETDKEKENKAVAKEKMKMDLRAILFSEYKPSAIINGKIIHVGDKLDDVVITCINKDGVEFEKNGETWSQKLYK
jgi:hypothetical protein